MKQHVLRCQGLPPHTPPSAIRHPPSTPPTPSIPTTHPTTHPTTRSSSSPSSSPPDSLKARAAKINEKLGDKFEISEGELTATYDACQSLISAGADITAGDVNAGARILAEAE